MLGNEHIDWIKKWVYSHNIQYLDVRLEIIDHIASGAEATLQSGDNHRINDIVRGEMKKWPAKKLIKLIKTKRHHLYWGWHKRMFKYFFKYFKLPKIIILIGLTSSIYSFLLTQINLDVLIDTISNTTIVLYFLSIFYSATKKQISSTGWNQLLSIESYNKTVLILPAIPHLATIAITSAGKDGLTQTDLLLYSFGLSMSLILIHAFLFVFPKMLKRDTLQYYDHLKSAL